MWTFLVSPQKPTPWQGAASRTSSAEIILKMVAIFQNSNPKIFHRWDPAVFGGGVISVMLSLWRWCEYERLWGFSLLECVLWFDVLEPTELGLHPGADQNYDQR